MKTNVVIETIDRELCGVIVKQRTKDTFMNLDDITNLVIRARLENGQKVKGFNFSDWLTSETTMEFLKELEKEIGASPYIRGGKGKSGWVHPFFAIKILTHFNPKFEVQVYKWLWDYLIQNRINSGDSYTKMCGIAYKYANRKDRFAKGIKFLANKIKELIDCDDWNKATQKQLEERDYLQNLISDLIQTFKDSNQGINIAFKVYEERKQSLKLENK